MRRSRTFLLSVAALLAGTSLSARADGLGDLRAALQRASGQAPVKAAIDLRTWQRLGDGPDADQGQIALTVEDGANGLHLSYPRATVARIESEQRARARNPDAKTPTLAALRGFDTLDILPMVSTGSWLTRMIDRAVFRGERSDTHAGKPARLLTFEVPLSALNKRERKYAPRLDSVFEVWTAADGTPLASRTTQTLFGRAFVVIGFEARLEDESLFGMVGDRLLTLRKVTRNSTAGAGEKDERKTTQTLQVL
jgi:hypothetical protein